MQGLWQSPVKTLQNPEVAKRCEYFPFTRFYAWKSRYGIAIQEKKLAGALDLDFGNNTCHSSCH